MIMITGRETIMNWVKNRNDKNYPSNFPVLNQLKESKYLENKLIMNLPANMHYEIMKYMGFNERMALRATSLGGYQLFTNPKCLARIIVNFPQHSPNSDKLYALLNSKLPQWAKKIHLQLLFEISNVKNLTLNSLVISQESMEILISSLQYTQELKILNLSCMAISDRDICEIVKGFEYIFHSLSQLLLWGNNLKDTGVEKLALLLPILNNLEVLNLGFNHIGELGAKQLSIKLKNPLLQKLNLGKNKIGKGIEFVSNQLMECPLLRSLDLGNTEMGDLGAGFLASNLKYIPLLTHFILTENDIGDEGTSVIADNLYHLPQLAEFYYGDNMFGYFGAEKLVEYLSSIERNIFLSFVTTTEEAKEVFKDKLKNRANIELCF